MLLAPRTAIKRFAIFSSFRITCGRKINSTTTSISQSISQSHLQLTAMIYPNIDSDTSPYFRGRQHKQCARYIDVRSLANKLWLRKCIDYLFYGTSTFGDCLRCGRKIFWFNRKKSSQRVVIEEVWCFSCSIRVVTFWIKIVDESKEVQKTDGKVYFYYNER